MSASSPRLLEFANRLNQLPCAVSIAQVEAPDRQLMFVNDEFERVTGFGPSVLGRNSRFLQADFDNGIACQAISRAFSYCNGIQVILRNRKANGQAFANLMSLGFIGRAGSPDHYIVGTMFDLGDIETTPGGQVIPRDLSQLRHDHPSLPFRQFIERQRALSETARHLIEMLLLIRS